MSVQLYEAASCRSIIDHAREVGAWTQAKVSTPSGAGIHSDIRPEERLASVLAPTPGSRIGLEFDEKMESIIKPIVQEVWGVTLKQHSETHFVRYAAGNYYRAHSDTGLDRNDRYFTVICYLNDDFGGGRTNFPRLNHSVIPHCGKAVIFPSTYLHYAEPVTRGEKHIIVSWLTGPPPIRWMKMSAH